MKNGDRIKSTGSSTRPILFYFAAIVLLVALAIRLWAMAAGRTVPDADECVVGIMALNVASGQEHPVYFYGQNYGAGAGLEAHLAAAAFKLFSPSGVVLKAVGLLFWISALTLAGALAWRTYGKTAGLTALILAGSAPCAAEWSMKTRGGHLPALVLLLAAALFAARSARREAGADTQSRGGYFLAGLAAALAAWCQPSAAPAAASIWLLAFIAILLQDRKWSFVLLGGPALVGALTLLTPAGRSAWSSPIISDLGSRASSESITRAVTGIFTPYLDPIAFELDTIEKAAASIWALAFIYVAVAALKNARLAARGPGLIVAGLIALPIPSTFAALWLVPDSALAPRHLLAAYPFACVGGAAVIGLLWPSHPRAFGAVLFLLAGSGLLVTAQALSRPTFHNPGVGYKMSRACARDTISALEARGVSHVFVADMDFKWNLIFESRGKIKARSRSPIDRRQEYVDEVDRAFRLGLPTAIVVPNPEGAMMKPIHDALANLDGVETINPCPETAIIFNAPPQAAAALFPGQASE